MFLNSKKRIVSHLPPNRAIPESCFYVYLSTLSDHASFKWKGKERSKQIDKS